MIQTKLLMKNILLCLTLVLSAITVDAQTLTMDRVPKAVQAAFHSKYVGAQQESWELVASNTYQVAFFSAKKRLTARFDNMGKWLETEMDVTNGGIPRAVSNAIPKNFQGYDVQMMTQIEAPDGTLTYEVVVFRGRDNYDVIFSAKGEILKKETGAPNE